MAADHMICESIKAVLRLVIRPGLINVGLDDLMSALRTTRSRCLFGSGTAEGKDRAAKALRGALASPLLDQGALLKDAQTVLVHLCGGEDLTLFEIELMMQSLQKVVPEKAHVLFGAAIDPVMDNKLSVTLISALPEDSLAMAPRESLSRGDDNDNPLLDPSQGFTKTAAPKPVAKPLPSTVATPPKIRPEPVVATPALFDDEQPFAEPALPSSEKTESASPMFADPPESGSSEEAAGEKPAAVMVAEFIAVPANEEEELESCLEAKPVDQEENPEEKSYGAASGTVEEDILENEPDDLGLEAAGFRALPPKRPEGAKPWTTAMGSKEPVTTPDSSPEPEPPKLKLGIKAAGPQSELSLDATPRGRFEGENPNVFDGEDLDLPPFLRKKK
jgi:cell division protein FtsZ